MVKKDDLPQGFSRISLSLFSAKKKERGRNVVKFYCTSTCLAEISPWGDRVRRGPGRMGE